MSSCIDSSLKFYGSAVNCNVIIPAYTCKFAQKIEEGEESALNYLWIYPINLAGSLIGIALAPVAALIHLAAAAVLGCFGVAACSDKCKAYSLGLLCVATGQLIDVPIKLFLSIFYPAIDTPTNISGSLLTCFGLGEG